MILCGYCLYFAKPSTHAADYWRLECTGSPTRCVDMSMGYVLGIIRAWNNMRALCTHGWARCVPPARTFCLYRTYAVTSSYCQASAGCVTMCHGGGQARVHAYVAGLAHAMISSTTPLTHPLHLFVHASTAACSIDAEKDGVPELALGLYIAHTIRCQALPKLLILLGVCLLLLRHTSASNSPGWRKFGKHCIACL